MEYCLIIILMKKKESIFCIFGAHGMSVIFFHEIFIFGILAIFWKIVFISLKTAWYHKKSATFFLRKMESEEKQKCDNR